MFHNDLSVRKSEIIVIGNEVTSGLIVETNSRVISSQLNAQGIDVSRITMVGDDAAMISDAVEQALDRAEIVITTGGLGPTHDDITKHVLAKLFDSTMTRNKRVVSMIEFFFSKRGRKTPTYALSQADVPTKAEILYNEKGSAPGLLFSRDTKKLYALPGVPLEMEHLLEKYILPKTAEYPGKKIGHLRLLTTGITESALWAQIGKIESIQETISVASLPSHLGVTIRLSISHSDDRIIKQKLKIAEAFLRKRIGQHIYGIDDDILEEVVGKLIKKKGLSLVVAESCTGGLIGHRVTNVQGSSDYFKQGFVVYSNEAKVDLLGVKPETIEKFGAVSQETAIAMSDGARLSSKADVALAVTGIAGPTGGSPDKPVGLTYIALSTKWASQCDKFVFPQDRIRNKERAAQAALNLLRQWLLGQC